MQMNQRETKMKAESHFEVGGPPSSPPTANLLMISRMKQTMEVERYIITEKARSPAGTLNTALFLAWYEVEITHGSPRPRKTLTQFDPVTLLIAASAYWEVQAAVLLAKVSGREVPRATKVMAVTDGLSPMTQPKIVATSPTNIVTRPM